MVGGACFMGCRLIMGMEYGPCVVVVLVVHLLMSGVHLSASTGYGQLYLIRWGLTTNKFDETFWR